MVLLQCLIGYITATCIFWVLLKKISDQVKKKWYLLMTPDLDIIFLNRQWKTWLTFFLFDHLSNIFAKTNFQKGRKFYLVLAFGGMTKRQKYSLKFLTETETNKTLKTENFYWKLYFTENRFRIDVKNTEKWEQELKMRMNLKNKWLGPKIKKKFILPFLVIWPWPRGIWPWPDPIRGFCPRATFLLFKKSFLLFESLFFHFLQDYILLR